MGVKVRPFRSGGWEVDVTARLPDLTIYRKRFKASATSRTLALREGENLLAEIIRLGAAPVRRTATKEVEVRKAVPTVEEFKATFLTNHSGANRLKHSSVAAQESIFRSHLIPLLGKKRLDEITAADVQALKGRLKDRSAKTANNVLSVLSKLLKVAVEWDVLDEMPAKIKLLKTDVPVMAFYDPAEFERLVEAAKRLDSATLLIVLLGGEAGLRAGEVLGLEWGDVDFARGFLTVARAEWCKVVASPKGGRSRRVPLTKRLLAALAAHRHLAGRRVLAIPSEGDDALGPYRWMRSRMKSAQRLAGLNVTGNLHILRHTFCSRLAMAGRTVLEIKELAGHAHLSTTTRYMHLSPSMKEAAIRSLEALGDILETEAKTKGAPEGTPIVTAR